MPKVHIVFIIFMSKSEMVFANLQELTTDGVSFPKLQLGNSLGTNAQ